MNLQALMNVLYKIEKKIIYNNNNNSSIKAVQFVKEICNES